MPQRECPRANAPVPTLSSLYWEELHSADAGVGLQYTRSTVLLQHFEYTRHGVLVHPIELCAGGMSDTTTLARPLRTLPVHLLQLEERAHHIHMACA